MIGAGQMTRRVLFSQRALDANGDALGPYEPKAERSARVQALRGGEAVQEQRLAGQQPVIITVRADGATRTIDNGFEARDVHDASIVWDVQSKIETEDRRWIEVLAVQRKAHAAQP